MTFVVTTLPVQLSAFVIESLLEKSHPDCLELLRKQQKLILEFRGNSLVQVAEKGNTAAVDRLILVYGTDVNHVHTSPTVRGCGTYRLGRCVAVCCDQPDVSCLTAGT